MAKTIETKIQEQLQVIEWQIRDAKADIFRAAQLFAGCAQHTLDGAEKLVNNQASSISSTSFMPSGIQNGTDAYNRLRTLVEKRDLLNYLLRNDDDK